VQKVPNPNSSWLVLPPPRSLPLHREATWSQWGNIGLEDAAACRAPEALHAYVILYGNGKPFQPPMGLLELFLGRLPCKGHEESVFLVQLVQLVEEPAIEVLQVQEWACLRNSGTGMR